MNEGANRNDSLTLVLLLGRDVMLDPDGKLFLVGLSTCWWFLLLTLTNLVLFLGMSVIVSVQFVCWFPTLDSGMVLEKIVQRLIGTFVGAAIGLFCGFVVF